MMSMYASPSTPKAAVQLAKSIIREPYAWPGGYARLAVMNDGELVCPTCLETEFRNVFHSTRGTYGDGWQVVGSTSTAEMNHPEDEYCAHCNVSAASL